MRIFIIIAFFLGLAADLHAGEAQQGHAKVKSDLAHLRIQWLEVHARLSAPTPLAAVRYPQPADG
jgi:hypothetical protein